MSEDMKRPPIEFPNEFGKRGGQILFEDGSPVSSLCWVGMRRELYFTNTTAEGAMSGEKIPQYMIITPGVMAYSADGNRYPKLLNSHEVWFSMS